MDQQPIISFRNFSFRYRAQKQPTLRDINLDIFPGERIVIAGLSGSGKSTIGNCINGLIPFRYPGEFSGSLTVNGIDAPHSSIFKLSTHVGTVLQDPDGQFIGLTVAEDIAFALENACTAQDEMKEIVEKTARLVDIDRHLTKAPHELSGGQKQRVSLAGVMVDDVKILLFDEPLANLDPATGKQTIELIDDIQKRTGATVIIIEHRLEDVLWRHVDRIILMDEGAIIADATPDELLCTSKLSEHGIREPLYLTALKYAGVGILPENKPAHPDTLILSEADKEKVRQWFAASRQKEAPASENPVLECRDLTFGYTPDTTHLENINFSVNKGEMLAIVGRNGAGKSTLAKLICGFETPNRGDLLLNGQTMAGQTIRERASRIGYVMQNPHQMISKTMIYDEVAMGLKNSGLSEEEIRSRVEETLKICGLYPFRNWPVSALSFGQKKRVTIASILALEPDMVILDEPTAGQDFRHYTEIMEFLRELNRSGVTVVMITHDMHLMSEYCRRAVVFAGGRNIADAAPADILTDPDIIAQASLKETSLYDLAVLCGIDQPREFVRRFIDYDREVRR